MNVVKYPDGSSYVEVKKDSYSQYPEVSTIRINTYEDLHHLEQFVDAMNNLGYKPTVTIPNLIDAQADRRFAENQSSGLKIVCKRLKGMNANFKIFHPHNPEVVEALMDVEIIDNSNFIAEVVSKITSCSYNNGKPYAWDDRKFNDGTSSIDRYNNLILMASDAGGFKPLMKLCDKLNWKGVVHSCSKNRYYANGETHLNQICNVTDFDGKDILIIDDICIYGGTFKGLSKLLKERNCGKLYLAVSHMTVQDLGEDPVTNYFDKVFTTNSKYDHYFVRDSEAGGKQHSNLIIIKMF